MIENSTIEKNPFLTRKSLLIKIHFWQKKIPFWQKIHFWQKNIFDKKPPFDKKKFFDKKTILTKKTFLTKIHFTQNFTFHKNPLFTKNLFLTKIHFWQKKTFSTKKNSVFEKGLFVICDFLTFKLISLTSNDLGYDSILLKRTIIFKYGF